jgi:hypothetical protein
MKHTGNHHPHKIANQQRQENASIIDLKASKFIEVQALRAQEVVSQWETPAVLRGLDPHSSEAPHISAQSWHRQRPQKRDKEKQGSFRTNQAS